MRLKSVRVQNFRSIRDTGTFDVEGEKAIFVGPNEAGKSAVLQAIQQLNPPKGTKGFDALRDYPRALYNDITTGKVIPKDVNVVEGIFSLSDSDKNAIPEAFRGCSYKFTKYLDNSETHGLVGAPDTPRFKDIKADLLRLEKHIVSQIGEDVGSTSKFKDALAEVIGGWNDEKIITVENCKNLKPWLEESITLIEEDNTKEESRLAKINSKLQLLTDRTETQNILYGRRPVFVLYSNYFRVRPNIFLDKLADRTENNSLDDEAYDYGNNCLLKLLGFTARELSDLGKVQSDEDEDSVRTRLDTRDAQLNSASYRLTEEIRKIWNPNIQNQEANKIVIKADQQYLKVSVEDSIGVQIELDQRSEGFQWLVSFFVVFFAEAQDSNVNAVLLLDEPGLNLHALKQREFRHTISRLSKKNQTIYTTHSPFLVGSDELDMVRVVEMTDRTVGTKLHTRITASDPAALLPLQEALGYDLAQSLFTQRKNLVLEGLTDYWYIAAAADMLRADEIANLDETISLIPANTAGKVVYYATILHAQNLKVAALLDSDNAGNQAANQETLVHTLGNKKILRTADFLKSPITKSEIEDLFRDTLIEVAKESLGWDVKTKAATQPTKSVVKILEAEIPGFSKYKLAKAFVRWTRDNDASKLTENEREGLKVESTYHFSKQGIKVNNSSAICSF